MSKRIGGSRQRCRFGAGCYRTGDEHRKAFAHPGDADWDPQATKNAKESATKSTAKEEKAKAKSFSMGPKWLSTLSEEHLLDFRGDLAFLAKKHGLCEAVLADNSNLSGRVEIRLVADDVAVLDAAKEELVQSGLLDHHMRLSPEEEKEVQKLEKQLRDIADIEARVTAGEFVVTLQKKKIEKKDELLSSIARIRTGEATAPTASAKAMKADRWDTKRAEGASATKHSIETARPEAKKPDRLGLDVAKALVAERCTPINRAAVGELALPQAGCRVHFSGCLMYDQQVAGTCSAPYVEDLHSEYVGEGRYPSNMKAFPKAIGASFDSVAVDAGTRVTIYSKPDFQGEVLWDRVGPAIVVNTKWGTSFMWPFCKGQPYSQVLKQEWKGALGALFPPEVRELSCSDMHTWNSGSLIIQSGQSIPKRLDGLDEYKALPNPRY